MFIGSEEEKKKGIETEKKFREWLDNHNIPYMYIQQDIETFSSTFNKLFTGKRPDFMILVPNFGLIFVDVKYKNITPHFNTFPIDTLDAKKYSKLQRKFNMHIWYALSNENVGYKTWYWVPVSKVFEEGRYTEEKSGKSGMPFFAVKIEDFTQISDEDSLERLFSKCFSD